MAVMKERFNLKIAYRNVVHETRLPTKNDVNNLGYRSTGSNLLPYVSIDESRTEFTECWNWKQMVRSTSLGNKSCSVSGYLRVATVKFIAMTRSDLGTVGT